MLLGLSLALALAAIAYRLGMLSRSGLTAATLLGAIVYGFGGLPWALLLILFFASSSFSRWSARSLFLKKAVP